MQQRMDLVTLGVSDFARTRDFYESTRRKLGMVGGVCQSPAVCGSNSLAHKTVLPNLFIVGDTVSPGVGIAAVTQSALIVANEIAPLTRR